MHISTVAQSQDNMLGFLGNEYVSCESTTGTPEVGVSEWTRAVYCLLGMGIHMVGNI